MDNEEKPAPTEPRREELREPWRGVVIYSAGGVALVCLVIRLLTDAGRSYLNWLGMACLLCIV
ncbi:MAG TPA: hypothetical protein PKK06_01750 [Phycisphaerae bacterium]|nr:hypothetical protein [Phycisphaerae bacterium]HNU44152.1 hypothetical protein [Phycisphaerae bacterium]